MRSCNGAVAGRHSHVLHPSADTYRLMGGDHDTAGGEPRWGLRLGSGETDREDSW